MNEKIEEIKEFIKSVFGDAKEFKYCTSWEIHKKSKEYIDYLIAECERLEKENEALKNRNEVVTHGHTFEYETKEQKAERDKKFNIYLENQKLQRVVACAEIDWEMVLDILKNVNADVLAETDCATQRLIGLLILEIKNLQQALKESKK